MASPPTRWRVIRWDDSPLTISAPSETTLENSNFAPTAGDLLELVVQYKINFHPGDKAPGEALPETAKVGYLTYGPYLMGFSEDHFVAEPDWGNTGELE